MAAVEIAVKGGIKLQKALEEIAKRSETAKAVQVGFMAGATYPDGTPVAMVAAIQNFGAPAAGIPARPFFSGMVDKKSPEWGESLGHILKATHYDAEKSLGQMGEGISDQLRESIRDLESPPLQPATIKNKGFGKPLIDTGHMLNSVDYKVNE